MDLGLRGRTALVTGSYRGTGAGIARVLAAEGATVLVHGLERGQTDGTVGEITAAGGRAAAVTGDLYTEAGTAQLVAEVQALRVDGAAPHVDIVVNNWGRPEGSDWEASDTASWHGSYDVNVVSAVRVTQAFLPAMRDSGWGRVVFVSTVGATRPGDRIPEYYAAKGALPSVAVGLAKHLAGSGVTVNCVSPGMIATDEIIDMYTARGEAWTAHRSRCAAAAHARRGHDELERASVHPRRRRPVRRLCDERGGVASRRSAPPLRRRRQRCSHVTS